VTCISQFNAKEIFGLIPLSQSFFKCSSLCTEPICIRGDDSLERLRVGEHFDRTLIVPDEIVVQFNSPWLLVLHNDFANLQEQLINCTVLIIECLGSLETSRALEGLQNDKEFSNEFCTFSHQQILIQMNPHIISIDNFEFEHFTLLVLVKIHCKNKSALSMGLSPLLRLWVVEIESTYTLAHLVHHIHPK